MGKLPELIARDPKRYEEIKTLFLTAKGNCALQRLVKGIFLYCKLVVKNVDMLCLARLQMTFHQDLPSYSTFVYAAFDHQYRPVQKNGRWRQSSWVPLGCTGWGSSSRNPLSVAAHNGASLERAPIPWIRPCWGPACRWDHTIRAVV